MKKRAASPERSRRILIITEDNSEISGITNVLAKILFYLYIKLYKFLINLAVERYNKSFEVILLTNKTYKPENFRKTSLNLYDEVWGNINWEEARNEDWYCARNWYQGIKELKNELTLDEIFLNDIYEARVAMYLARYVLPYKQLIKDLISEYNPDMVVTITLNSPPENFAALIAYENNIRFSVIAKVNPFIIYKYIRRFFWKLDEKKILGNINQLCSAKQSSGSKKDVWIVTSHQTHLKSALPIIEKFKEKKVKAKIVSDIQDMYQISNKYGIDNNDFTSFFKYFTFESLIKDYLHYKQKFFKIINKSNKISPPNSYLDKYFRKDFKEKMAQYFGLSAIYVKSAKTMLEKDKPSSIIFISDRSAIEKSISIFANRLKIPTVLVSPNNIMSLDKTNEYNIADYVLVTGIHMKKELIKIGVNKRKIIIVGDLRLDNIHKRHFDRRKLFNKYGLDKNKKVIILISTYVSTAVPYNEKSNAFKLVNGGLKNLNNFQLVIKAHPNENIDVLRSQVKSWGIKGKVVSGNLHELLYISDAIAQTFSMTGFEAAIFRKPIFIINPKETYEKLIPYLSGAAAIGIYDEEEFSANLKKIENDSVFKKELLNNAEKFCSRYIRKIDGKATERLYDFVQDKI